MYIWPNGARYTVHYTDGRKKEQGKLEGSKVSLEELKDQYGSLLKKSMRAKEHQEFAVREMNNFHRAGAGKFEDKGGSFVKGGKKSKTAFSDDESVDLG